MYFGYGAKDVLESKCKNLQEKIKVELTPGFLRSEQM